jgi:copper oxidase (laccase) domain-containing protein
MMTVIMLQVLFGQNLIFSTERIRMHEFSFHLNLKDEFEELEEQHRQKLKTFIRLHVTRPISLRQPHGPNIVQKTTFLGTTIK